MSKKRNDAMTRKRNDARSRIITQSLATIKYSPRQLALLLTNLRSCNGRPSAFAQYTRSDCTPSSTVCDVPLLQASWTPYASGAWERQEGTMGIDFGFVSIVLFCIRNQTSSVWLCIGELLRLCCSILAATLTSLFSVSS